MSRGYSRRVNFASPLVSLMDENPDFDHVSDMTKRGVNPRSQQAIGDRIRWTRIALGNTAAQFAKRCGLSEPALNNYEAGKRRITLDQAWLICDAVGVNILWIYQGDMRDIRPELLEKIRRAMTDEPTKTTRPKAGRIIPR